MLLTLLAGCNPSYSYSEGINNNGYWKNVKATDCVEMINYKAFPVERSKFEMETDEGFKTEMEKAFKENRVPDFSSFTQITDRAITNYDTVSIDYVGKIDGVAFDGGSTEGAGTYVTIGITSYIGTFLEQLIGHKPGDKIDVKETFPQDYHEESLRGKAAVFETTINHIADKEEIKEKLLETSMKNYIWEYLGAEVNLLEMPDTVKSYQEKKAAYMENEMLSYFEEQAKSIGTDLNTFLQTYLNSDKNEEVEKNRTDVEQSIKRTIIIQAIAEDMNITVGNAEMEKYLPEYEKHVAEYGLPYLKQHVLSQIILDYIEEHAVLV